MAEWTVEARATSSAPIEAIYAKAAHSAGYPDWSPVGAYEELKPGDADGLGEVRLFRTGPMKIVEEVVELAPPRRISYVLLSGLPLSNYRATIDLSPRADSGTDIHWHARFAPSVPGTGLAMRTLMRRILGDMAKALGEG